MLLTSQCRVTCQTPALLPDLAHSQHEQNTLFSYQPHPRQVIFFEEHRQCQHLEFNFDCNIVDKVLVHVRFGSQPAGTTLIKWECQKTNKTNSQTWEKDKENIQVISTLKDGDHTSWNPFNKVDRHIPTAPALVLWRTRCERKHDETPEQQDGATS